MDLDPAGKQHRPFSVGAVVDVAPEAGTRRGKVLLVTGEAFSNSLLDRSRGQVDFGLNCFEWLAERLEKVDVRSDPLQVTVIDFGTDPEQARARMIRIFLLLVVFTPLFFVGLGLFTWWRRRRI